MSATERGDRWPKREMMVRTLSDPYKEIVDLAMDVGGLRRPLLLELELVVPYILHCSLTGERCNDACTQMQ